MVQWLEVKGNIFLIFLKPIMLQNDYTTGATTRVSNDLVTGFFLITKNVCNAFYSLM